jgi:uncharacterized membrane protein (DUF485 family)
MRGRLSCLPYTPPRQWRSIGLNDADPRLQRLYIEKTRLLPGLVLLSRLYCFDLPIGTAYFPEIFGVKVCGPVNLGVVFALPEFIIT